SLGQHVEQGLRLLQIERVEPLREPAIDRSENVASLIPLALVAPEPRHPHRRAQFPGLCLLRTRDRERAFEIRFRFRRIGLGRISGATGNSPATEEEMAALSMMASRLGGAP